VRGGYRITTGPRVTRRISASPVARSGHWWTVTVAMLASKLSSANGKSSEVASIATVSQAGRWVRIEAEGSTAVTNRSVGS
jgi:hypothetical protein